MRAALSLALLVAAAGINVVSAKCSPAEQVCGELCCCVTCTCLEGPFRCEDMWGKPTDPVGRIDDERFASREWTENMMREHHERHRKWLEEHEQRRRERREARRARGEPEDEDPEAREMRDLDVLREERMKAFGKLDGMDGEDGPVTLRERLAELKERRARHMKRRRHGGMDDSDTDEDAAHTEL